MFNICSQSLIVFDTYVCETVLKKSGDRYQNETKIQEIQWPNNFEGGVHGYAIIVCILNDLDKNDIDIKVL